LRVHWNTENLPRPWEIIEVIEPTSSQTQVEFTGLGDDEHQIYRISAGILNVTGSVPEIRIYVNGDTTNSNYRTQGLFLWGSNADGGRASDPGPLIWVSPNDRTAQIDIDVQRVDGTFAFQSVGSNHRNDEFFETHYQNGFRASSIGEIESLRLQASVSNAIGSGSRFVLMGIAEVGG
jgi:hypothetical protein